MEGVPKAATFRTPSECMFHKSNGTCTFLRKQKPNDAGKFVLLDIISMLNEEPPL